MTDDTKQTVADDANVQSQTDTAAGGAQEPTLDELLSEFTAGAPEPQQQADQTLKPDDVKEVVDWAREEKERRTQELDERDLSEAVKTVKGELDIEDEDVEGWLYVKAAKDRRIATAWANRAKDPQAWNRLVPGLAREYQKRHESKPDRDATEDRAAVTAAVRGASNTPPDTDEIPANVASMSDMEFESWVKSQAK